MSDEPAPQVIVLGSVNADLIVFTPHLPAPGETVLGSDVVYQPGGKGSNQAVAAKRLGAHTALIAATGDDQLGAEVRLDLSTEGIDSSGVTIEPGTPTGVALIVVDDHGENSIVVATGANRLLGDGAVAHLTDLVSNASVLVLQLEVPVSTCRRAAEAARAAGATVLLNAAPMPALVSDEFANLLKAVDVLVLNQGEATQLAGSEVPPGSDGWFALAQQLHGLGPSTVVITLGSRGVVASGQDGPAQHPAFSVDVVDTTGAGDAFVGALAVALGISSPLPDSLRFACASAAIATTKIGAQPAMPSADDVKKLLATSDA